MPDRDDPAIGPADPAPFPSAGGGAGSGAAATAANSALPVGPDDADTADTVEVPARTDRPGSGVFDGRDAGDLPEVMPSETAMGLVFPGEDDAGRSATRRSVEIDPVILPEPDDLSVPAPPPRVAVPPPPPSLKAPAPAPPPTTTPSQKSRPATSPTSVVPGAPGYQIRPGASGRSSTVTAPSGRSAATAGNTAATSASGAPAGVAAPARPARSALRKWGVRLGVTAAVLTVLLAGTLWFAAPIILEKALVALLGADGRAKVEVEGVRYRFPLGAEVDRVRVWAPGHDDKPPVVDVSDVVVRLGGLPLPGSRIILTEVALTPRVTFAEVAGGGDTFGLWIKALTAALASDRETTRQQALDETLLIGSFVIKGGAVSYLPLGEPVARAVGFQDINLNLGNATDDGRHYRLRLDGDLGPFGELSLRGGLDVRELELTVLPESAVTVQLTRERLDKLPARLKSLVDAWAPRGRLDISKSRAVVRFKDLAASEFHMEAGLSRAAVTVPGIDLRVRRADGTLTIDNRTGVVLNLDGDTSRGGVQVAATFAASAPVKAPDGTTAPGHAWTVRVTHSEAGSIEAAGALVPVAGGGAVALGGSTSEKGRPAGPAGVLLTIERTVGDIDMARPLFLPFLPRGKDGGPLLTGLTGRVRFSGTAALDLTDPRVLQADITADGEGLALQVPAEQSVLEGGRLHAEARMRKGEAPTVTAEFGAARLARAGAELVGADFRGRAVFGEAPDISAKLSGRYRDRPLTVDASVKWAGAGPMPWQVRGLLGEAEVIAANGTLDRAAGVVSVPVLRVTVDDPAPVLALLPPDVVKAVVDLKPEGRLRIEGRAEADIHPARLRSADMTLTLAEAAIAVPGLSRRVTAGRATVRVTADAKGGRVELSGLGAEAVSPQGTLAGEGRAEVTFDPGFDPGKPPVLDVLELVLRHRAEGAGAEPPTVATLHVSAKLPLAGRPLDVEGLNLVADLAKLPAAAEVLGLPEDVRKALRDAAPTGAITLAGTAGWDLGRGRATAGALTLVVNKAGATVPGLPEPVTALDAKLHFEPSGAKLESLSADVGAARLTAVAAASWDAGFDPAVPVRFAAGELTLVPVPGRAGAGGGGAGEAREAGAVATAPLGAKVSGSLTPSTGEVAVVLESLEADVARVLPLLPAAWRPAVVGKLAPAGTVTGTAEVALRGGVAWRLRSDVVLKSASVEVPDAEWGLRGFGVTASVRRTPAGTVRVTLRDGEGKLVRLAADGKVAAEGDLRGLTGEAEAPADGGDGPLTASLQISETPVGPLTAMMRREATGAALHVSADARVRLADGAAAALLPEAVQSILREHGLEADLPVAVTLRVPGKGAGGGSAIGDATTGVGPGEGEAGSGVEATLLLHDGTVKSARHGVTATGLIARVVTAPGMGSLTVPEIRAVVGRSGTVTGSARVRLDRAPELAADVIFADVEVPAAPAGSPAWLRNLWVGGEVTARVPLDGRAWAAGDAVSLKSGRAVLDHVHDTEPAVKRRFEVADLAVTLTRPADRPGVWVFSKGVAGRVLGGAIQFDGEADTARKVTAVRVREGRLVLDFGDAITLPVVGAMLDEKSRPAGEVRFTAAVVHDGAAREPATAVSWRVDANLFNFSTRMGVAHHRLESMSAQIGADQDKVMVAGLLGSVHDGRVSGEATVVLPRAGRALKWTARARVERLDIRRAVNAGRKAGDPPTEIAGRLSVTEATAEGDDRGLDGLRASGKLALREGRLASVPLVGALIGGVQTGLSITPFRGLLDQTADVDAAWSDNVLTIRDAVVADPLVSFQTKDGRIRRVPPAAGAPTGPDGKPAEAEYRLDMVVSAVPLGGLQREIPGLDLVRGTLGKVLGAVLPLNVSGTTRQPLVVPGKPTQREDRGATPSSSPR